jgi:hypothetical protein
MKALIYIIGLFLLSCQLEYNPKSLPNNNDIPFLDSTYVAEKTSYFQVKNNAIIGDGKKEILDIFNTSQFVAFGEKHLSKPTSVLTKALIPIMKKAGFNDLCFEVGPHSAKKLIELSSPYNETVSKLKQFNNQYYYKPDEDTPIPFFSGIEDAMFLAEASKHEMKIWGIDQEYYFSILFLSDELLKKAKGNTDYNEIRNSKVKADSIFYHWFNIESESEDEVDVFKNILETSEVQTFFNYFPDEPIVKDIKISWDIYSRWRSGSHADRISYMRNNFISNLAARSKEIDKPKVFLKFGQVHTAKTISRGTFDLGHLTEEIAQNNGTISTSINSWVRYANYDNNPSDYVNEAFYKRVKLFIDFGRKEEWTIINFRSIRKDLANGKIALPSNGDFHEIYEYIHKYDYQFILPMNETVTPNYD